MGFITSSSIGDIFDMAIDCLGAAAAAAFLLDENRWQGDGFALRNGQKRMRKIQ